MACVAAGMVILPGLSQQLTAQAALEPSQPWTCWVMSGSTSTVFPSPVTDQACLSSPSKSTTHRGLLRRSVEVSSLALPGAPASLAASVNGRTVSLTWIPGPGEAPSSYLLEAGSSSGRSDLASTDTGSVTPALVATDVPPGAYFVRVRARNTVGTTDPSNEILVVVANGCAGAPSAPTGLTATATSSSVVLAWQAPTGSCPATTYVIEAGATPGLSNLAAFTTGSPLTTFNASGVADGTYYIRVRSANAAGTSGPSNEARLVVAIAGPAGGLFTIESVAGSGAPDIGDGRLAREAILEQPLGVLASTDGSVYIADTYNDRIRRVAVDGTITTVAGTGSGETREFGDGLPANQAQLRLPRSIKFGPDGALWIADTNNYRIRRIVPTGIIGTVAGGGGAFDNPRDDVPALGAQFGAPMDVAIDANGTYFVADFSANRIRRVGSDGIIRLAAQITGPQAL